MGLGLMIVVIQYSIIVSSCHGNINKEKNEIEKRQQQFLVKRCHFEECTEIVAICNTYMIGSSKTYLKWKEQVIRIHVSLYFYEKRYYTTIIISTITFFLSNHYGFVWRSMHGFIEYNRQLPWISVQRIGKSLSEWMKKASFLTCIIKNLQ